MSPTYGCQCRSIAYDLLILESDQTITVPSKIDGSDVLGIIDNGGVAVDDGVGCPAAASEFLDPNTRHEERY